MLLSLSSSAHEPHRPGTTPGPSTAAATATATGAPRPDGALPLPAGWVESPPPSAEKSFAPMLAADGDGVLATWLEPLEVGGHRVRFARWSAGTWSAATTVREGSTLFANWADVPGVVRAADRSLYVWWLEKSAAGTYAYDAQLARSTDQGATFQRLGPLHEDRSAVEHGFVSSAPEGAGVRFFFLDGRVTEKGAPMQLRSCLVEGDRVGPSEVIDDSVCDCCSTAAVALPGAAAVAYRDRTAEEIRDIRVAVRPIRGPIASQPVGKDRWRIAACPVNGPALAGDARRLAVAWYTAPEDRARLAVALSPDGGSTWGTPHPIQSTKPMGRVALAPLSAGFAVAWLERTGNADGGAELRLARVDDSGKMGRPMVLARTVTGRAGGVPRLAVTADRLVVSWVDADARRLRFAAIATALLAEAN